MTRSKALGIGLPAWTLVVFVWFVFVGATIEPVGCGQTIGGGVSADCAARMTNANLASFYQHTVPMIAAAVCGYALLGLLTVSSTPSRLKLFIVAAVVVVAFAVLARPLPVQPYAGS